MEPKNWNTTVRTLLEFPNDRKMLLNCKVPTRRGRPWGRARMRREPSGRWPSTSENIKWLKLWSEQTSWPVAVSLDKKMTVDKMLLIVNWMPTSWRAVVSVEAYLTRRVQAVFCCKRKNWETAICSTQKEFLCIGPWKVETRKNRWGVDHQRFETQLFALLFLKYYECLLEPKWMKHYMIKTQTKQVR